MHLFIFMKKDGKMPGVSDDMRSAFFWVVPKLQKLISESFAVYCDTQRLCSSSFLHEEYANEQTLIRRT